MPWQAFQAQDGYVVIATRQENFWRKLCAVLGEPGTRGGPALRDQRAAAARTARCSCPCSRRILRTRTVADWLARLRAAEVPAAPVNNLDGAFAEPPVAEREMIVEYDHPDVGRVRLPGNPIKMDGAGPDDFESRAAAGRAHRRGAARACSALPAERIAELRQQGVVA